MQPTSKAVGCDQSQSIIRLQENSGLSETSLQRTSSPFLLIIFCCHICCSQFIYILLDVLHFWTQMQPPHTNCAGHTSWSTSGLAYLSLWLAGKLRCFDGHGHPWKAIVSVMPTGLAVWIGITRLQVSRSAFASFLPLPCCSW